MAEHLLEVMKRHDKQRAELAAMHAVRVAKAAAAAKAKLERKEYVYQPGERAGLILMGIGLFFLLGLNQFKFIFYRMW